MKTMEETSIENYPISTYDALMIFPYLPILFVVFRHPSEKYDEPSVGNMKFPMESHKIPWFQTTNQMFINRWLIGD